MSSHKKTFFTCLLIFLSVLPAFAERLKDPTKPLQGAVNSESEALTSQGYRLQSIFISGENRRAIISNKKVAVGDVIGEFTVAKILRNKVLLQNETDSLELNLFRQAVTK